MALDDKGGQDGPCGAEGRGSRGGRATKGSAGGWHLASWPPLAWVETVVKLAAVATGIIAFAQVLSRGEFAIPQGLRLAQLIILGVLSLLLLAAIADRMKDKEIVAGVFVILNNAGHWGMVVALFGPAGPGRLLTVFASLMLAGDLVKLLFLRVNHFRVRNTAPAIVYGLTVFYAAGYAALLILQAAS